METYCVSNDWRGGSARRARYYRRAAGLTLIEAMLLLVTLSIVGVAAGVGLQSVSKVPVQTNSLMAVNSAVVDAMEKMKAEPWATMPAKAAALTTGSVVIEGNSYARTVTVAQADADGDGAADPDYRQITVTIGSRSMTTYVMQP